MAGFDFTPVVCCLLASVAWAPIVYLAAARLDRDRKPAMSELIWLGALAAAVLPTVLTPLLAAAGISLRPAPHHPDLAAAPIDVLIAAAALAAKAPTASAQFVTLDVIIKAAGLLYIYGVILAFAAWLVRAAAFALHVRNAKPAAYPQLAHALEDWRRRLGVSSRVQLRKSEAVSSVCVYGVFRPVIIIPDGIEARVSFNDLVLMGAHELAHVKRGDCLFFAACSISRILFWFNPFVKRLAARAELAAERSADRMVIEGGADRRNYAACFVEGLRFAAERARQAQVSVPSFTPFDRRSRRERLDAILSGTDPRQARVSKLIMGSTIVFAAVIAFAQAAFAVNPNERVSDTAVLSEAPVSGEVTLAYDAPIDKKIGVSRVIHKGVDIKAAPGEPIKAPADGVVVEATDVYQGKPGWGKVVVIRHRNGVITRYAHLGDYSVKRGDHVQAGDIIGEVGATGVVTGPHLHFETLVNGEPVDPVKALAAGAVSAPRPPNSAGIVAAPDTSQLAASPASPQLAARVNPIPAIAGQAARGDDADTQRAELAGGAAGRGSDRTQVSESLRKMREKLRAAKKKHAEAMAKLRAGRERSDGGDFGLKGFSLEGLHLDDFDLSGLDLSGIEINGLDLADSQINPEDLAALITDAQKAGKGWRKDYERAMERARREIDRARMQGERERHRAEEEARREAEKARLQADRERQRQQAEEDSRRIRDAQAQAARAQQEALAEARQAREEAQRTAANEREEALRRQAEAISLAQQNLSRERERIERMLAEIARERQQKTKHTK